MRHLRIPVLWSGGRRGPRLLVARGDASAAPSRRSARERASSISSSGPDTLRAARPSGVRLGHAVRGGDRLQRQRDRPGRLGQRRAAACSRASTTAARSPATRRPADASRRCRAGQRRALENYDNVFDGLKHLPHNSLDGVNYGVPHGRGPNLLIWNTEEVRGADDAGTASGSRAPTTRATSASSTRRTSSPMRRSTSWPRSPTSGSRTPTSSPRSSSMPRSRCSRSSRTGRSTGATFGDQITASFGGDVVIGTTWQYQVNGLGRGGADRGDQARRRLDRLVGHLDDRQRGGASELHVHVDGPHDVGRGERPGDRVLRRGADQRGGVRRRGGAVAGPLRADPRDRRGVLGGHLVLEHPAEDCADDDDSTTCVD